MRTGGYTLHQSLTLESAAIVKQAVSLARRRGHAQVTPLHVASAMISSSTGLLKRACLQSHSHPLQCKALELCFNVALNRLPTSASTPLISPHSHIPSLSNALVAAFKRAQAHQRRGSIENQQQQPILALKVEVEQLVISILDDPSVSRVMREAGFISTQVKSNVEKAVSLEKCTSPHPKEISTKSLVLGNSNPPQAMPMTSLSKFRLLQLNTKVQQNEDVMSVLEAMMNNTTKNTVIVSESPDAAERLVRELIEKFDKRDVPDDIKSVQFISVPLFTLRNVSREEFEVKLGELRALVKSYVSRGVVLYLGDLGWVSDYWCKCNGREQRDMYYYCPVEYMIMELSKLICGAGDQSKKLWLMGVATFQTYAKCRTGRPSLETLWSLHPLTIPLGNLALSLSLDSGMHDQVKKEPVDDLNWLFQKAGIKNQLTFCSDCSVNFKKEAQAVMSSKQEPSSSSLPSWLQQYKDENRKQTNNVDQECDKLKDLCKKWNSICNSVHKKPHFLGKVFNLSSPSPASSSTSTSSNGLNKSQLHKTLLNWPVVFEPSRPSKEDQTFLFEKDDEVSKPSSSAAKPELLSNPNSSPNSASSSEASQEIMEFSHKYKELSSENLNILCNALEKKVPWQKDIIPEIVSTILRCRSGLMMRSKSHNKNENREESWLFFLGVDHDGKETIARELAKNVFGSYDDFIAIGTSSFSSSTRADSNEEVISNKRARNEHGGSLYDRFSDAVRGNPSRVFYVEDVDQLDYRSLRQLKSAIKDGNITLADGEVVLMRDAIVVFSCENFSSESRSACSPPIGEKGYEKQEEKSDQQKECAILDLNIATEDGNDELDHNSDSETGILELVDKKVVFKIKVL
ncbi:protein SMAX1-LIKE 3 [Sesamum alatum]|uniref:Protein SMAX1-LIKE 3 n=1 Tax=Sesamum alatum TaxID=300844 RepID=A0AAE1YJ20_9LAMI|nr:protein SMAX1-LIKE 3 [Sesamum alatum]